MESEQELPPRAVLLTCDDDLRNTLTEMVPVLQEYGLSCLFFVTGASLGEVSSMLWYEQLYLMFLATKKRVVNLDMVRPGSRDRALTQDEKRALWWNLVKHLSKYEAIARQDMIEEVRRQLSLPDDWGVHLLSDPLRRRFLMLNATELRALVAAGMGVGAHTLTHPVLSQISPEAAWNEISESRCKLQQVIGKPVWALAYPFGDLASVTEREQEMAERAGFTLRISQCGRWIGCPDAAVCIAASAYFRRHESRRIRSPRVGLLPVIAPAFSGFRSEPWRDRHEIARTSRASRRRKQPTCWSTAIRKWFRITRRWSI